MKGNIAFSRAAGAIIVLTGVAVAGSLLLTVAAADREALVEERDAKAAFTGRALGVARQDGAASNVAAGQDPSVVAGSASLAAARVETLVRATLTGAGGVVLSSRAEMKGDTPEGGVAANRIEVQAVVQGPMDALQAGLFTLETGRPVILVDMVDLRRADEGETPAQGASQPTLTASVTLSAFWKPARPQ